MPYKTFDIVLGGAADPDKIEFMEHNMAAAEPITSLTLRRPDDWHLHLRDGAMLAAVVADTAQHFGRAIVMPNLVPPVVTGLMPAPTGTGFWHIVLATLNFNR